MIQRKLKSALVLTGILAVSGCASSGNLEKTQIQVRTLEERVTALSGEIDGFRRELAERKEVARGDYCFTNDLAFSEGAIYAGQICERSVGIVVFRDGKSVPQLLQWKPYKYN